MEITLLRHGKPNISHRRWLSAYSFSHWVESYNLASLSENSNPPISAIEHASNCKAVVCSELVRSTESSIKLQKNKITLSSAMFNEAGLPIAKWKFIKLPPKLWAIFFRVLWLFGYSNNSESFSETKLRATESANKLIALAQEYEKVLFIGHGVYNRILSRKLIEAGWSGERTPSAKHWGFSVYTL